MSKWTTHFKEGNRFSILGTPAEGAVSVFTGSYKFLKHFSLCECKLKLNLKIRITLNAHTHQEHKYAWSVVFKNMTICDEGWGRKIKESLETWHHSKE